MFFSTLAGGGLERMMLTTAGALSERGYKVDVVVADAQGPLAGFVPAGVRLVELQRGPIWLARARILQAEPPTLESPLTSLLLALKLPNRLPWLPESRQILPRRKSQSRVRRRSEREPSRIVGACPRPQ